MSFEEGVAGHATHSHHQLSPFPGCPWLLRIGAYGSADPCPSEDFAVGSGTLSLLVVNAWAAREELQMPLKELTLMTSKK